MFNALFHGFEFGFIGSIPIAGPVAALVLKMGLEGRYAAGRWLAGGASIAEACYAGLAFWGVAGMLVHYPVVDLISRGVAAAFLLVLGFLFVRPRRPAPQRPSGSAPPLRIRWSFGLGLTVGLSNVALIATYSAVIIFLNGLGTVTLTVADAPAFGLGAGAGSLCWFTLMLGLLRRYGMRLATGRPERLMHIAGWLMLALGLALSHRFLTQLV